MRSTPGRGDRGSMTVVALGLVSCLLLALVGVLAVTSAAAAAHRARSAADLAALAAATAVASGQGEGGCAAATRVARLNDAEVTGCRTGGDGTVAVSVAAPVPFRLGGLGVERAHATARAGPWSGLAPSIVLGP